MHGSADVSPSGETKCLTLPIAVLDKTTWRGPESAAMPPAREHAPPTPATITGLLLAGGMGSRMGGVDKGLVEFAGRPLAAWVLERLTPQVGRVLVNANRGLETWRTFGHPVISDRIEGYAGPLAGLHAGLAACTTPWLATAPCDSPLLPADYVARLAAAAIDADADLAVASTEGRWQPVFALLRNALLGPLEEYLHGGGRKIDRWFAGTRHVVVEFEDPAAFANINTPDELRALHSST